MCSFLVWKNACLNYREFDLEGDLVGVPHTWYLFAQSFIRLVKLVWREYDIVAMNEWKKKCVGLQRTWVSKRTVQRLPWNSTYHSFLCLLKKTLVAKMRSFVLNVGVVHLIKKVEYNFKF